MRRAVWQVGEFDFQSSEGGKSRSWAVSFHSRHQLLEARVGSLPAATWTWQGGFCIYSTWPWDVTEWGPSAGQSSDGPAMGFWLSLSALHLVV